MNVLTKSLVKDIKLLSTTEELNDVIEALKIQQKFIRAHTSRSARLIFAKGDKVNVNDSRGLPLYGTVEKVNRTKAIVSTSSGRYNVPFSIMTLAS